MSAISGFPEWLPQQYSILNAWKQILAHHFESFCFTAMDTPVVERMSTLLSKGDDSEIYALMRWADLSSQSSLCSSASDATYSAQHQLGLRFDLTIPLARYVTENHGQLCFPYRRYHIAPVWRGERPQAGRFRQFYQCDIDTIDQENLAQSCDSETIFILHQALAALGIDGFLGPVQWHLNHRGVLIFWAQTAGVQDISAALRMIDKAEKFGLKKILSGLRELHASPESLDVLESWASYEKSPLEHIQHLGSLSESTEFHQALNDLGTTIRSLVARGMPLENILFNPLLARGLSYYSGVTFEAKLLKHLDLGSICAGGRYDRLATTLDAKKTFPGVGGSLGLSRLFARYLEETTPSLQAGDILICPQNTEQLDWYIHLGDRLRNQGWRVEVFLKQAPLKNQLKYANRKGFPLVILANSEEIQSGAVQLKVMSDRTQSVVFIPDLIDRIKAQLSV